MHKPLVSIITPTYNHEKFIGQCIESILAQTYPHWEQIIIDDGSTDNTGDVVSRYKDSRIKYICQENVGIWRLAETYNKALNMSHGEFIAILEGDDFWPAHKLEKQLPSFSDPEVVLSFGKTVSTNSKGEPIFVYPKNIKWFNNKTMPEIISKLLQKSFIHASTVMCRKQALLSIGGFKQPSVLPGVDRPTWLELGLIGKFQPIEEILGYWRQHEAQVSTTMAIAQAEGNKFTIEFYDKLDNETKSMLFINRNDLIKYHQQNLVATNFHLGRVALFNNNWHEAKNHFLKAIPYGTFSLKTIAFIGLIFSFFKIDMEWLALLTFRPRLKKMLY
jgi:glycosyltransferase involved in cell wall biosynthesis